MPEEIDPEKQLHREIKDHLELTRQALAVLRQLVELQGQRIDNLENWAKKLERKLGAFFNEK